MGCQAGRDGQVEGMGREERGIFSRRALRQVVKVLLILIILAASNVLNPMAV